MTGAGTKKTKKSGVAARSTGVQTAANESGSIQSATKEPVVKQPVKQPAIVPSTVAESGVKQSTNVVSQSIATKAFEIWKERGCQHGGDWHDWFQAEQELRAKN